MFPIPRFDIIHFPIPNDVIPCDPSISNPIFSQQKKQFSFPI